MSLKNYLSLIILLLGLPLIRLSAQSGPLNRDTVGIPGSEISFELVYLPGGEFLMGDSSHPVALSPFWIGSHEVTHDEYRLFQFRDNDTDASRGPEGTYSADAVTRPTPPYLDLTYGMGTRGGFPAVNMLQQAALRYCQWLYGKTGQFFRLPTEAEWEYACRAGSEEAFPVGVDPGHLEDYAWYYDNGSEKYHPVGQKKPNAWGLYDMLGNVAEWTLDHYDAAYFQTIGTPAADPWVKPSRKHSRTVRGGSYDSFKDDCRCTARQKSQAKWQARDPQIPKSIWWNVDAPFVGFRLVRPVRQPAREEVEAFFRAAIVD